MKRRLAAILLSVMIILAIAPFALAKEEPQKKSSQKQRSTNVVVAEAKEGSLIPTRRYVGTIFYPEVSELSAEISGTVERIAFKEGDRIKQGDLLVKIDSTLTGKNLEAKKALHEQMVTDIEKAEKDLARTAVLYEKKIVSEKSFDDQDFYVKSLRKKAAALKAERERIEVEFSKAHISAPFDGIVLKKHCSPGEWLAPGKPVATVAMDRDVDIIVDVPSRTVQFLRTGDNVRVTANGKDLSGTVTAIIPRGDVETRTFPVKISMKNPGYLMEGMAASAEIPSGLKRIVFFVPRDAVIMREGKKIVAAVTKGKVSILPVNVIGYQDMECGIESGEIKEDMMIVIKGQERLRNSQMVTVIEEKK